MTDEYTDEEIEALEKSLAKDPRWKKQIELDKALLSPAATSKKLVITVPAFERKEVAVLYLDREKKPFQNPDGNPFYVVTESNVFTGYESKEIDLPGEEIYNIDLVSSFLSPLEITALRTLISLYGDLQLQALNGKPRREDLYYIYNRICSVINTAKSREGRTARLSKTTIHEGTQKQSILEEIQQNVKKKSLEEDTKWR